jgi:hypothetical protein
MKSKELSKRHYQFHEIIRYDAEGKRVLSVSHPEWDGNRDSDFGILMDESMTANEKIAQEMGFYWSE